MSATAPVSQLSFADTRPVSMGTLVKVEMRKMYDTRAGKWLLGITAGLVVVANIIALIVFTTQDVDDIQYGTFIAITSYVSGIFLPILGIMLVTQEWGQRTGMVTFTLEPHRERVILAKGLAGLLLSLGCIVLGLAIGLVMNLLYGAIHGPIGWDLGLKYMGGFALTQAIAMLAGFALAALFLNTACCCPARLCISIAAASNPRLFLLTAPCAPQTAPKARSIRSAPTSARCQLAMAGSAGITKMAPARSARSTCCANESASCAARRRGRARGNARRRGTASDSRR